MPRVDTVRDTQPFGDYLRELWEAHPDSPKPPHLPTLCEDVAAFESRLRNREAMKIRTEQDDRLLEYLRRYLHLQIEEQTA